ncbi:MAG: hypothetical protein ACT4QE_17385, partial [Anaerolineales bacterium]
QLLTRKAPYMTSQLLSRDNSILLRWTLLGNVIFSAATGLACVLGAWPLTTLMGLPPMALGGLPSPFILIVLGLGLIGYAALLYRIARRQPIARTEALIAVAADTAWVVASWVLLLSGWVPFTQAGWWLTAIIADIVALFAIVQFIGVRQMGR